MTGLKLLFSVVPMLLSSLAPSPADCAGIPIPAARLAFFFSIADDTELSSVVERLSAPPLVPEVEETDWLRSNAPSCAHDVTQ